MQQPLPCPQVGHKGFQNSLKEIHFGDQKGPAQISKFIRPADALEDGMGAVYRPGELQRKDLSEVPKLFAYVPFIARTFDNNRNIFQHSECRIYQFQAVTRSNEPFIFGLFLTDGNNNLIDFCVEQRQSHKRRPVLVTLMRAICTPESFNKRIGH